MNIIHILLIIDNSIVLFTVRVWAAQNRIEADSGGASAAAGCPTCAAAT